MNTSSMIDIVSSRFPAAVSASHTYRGDATLVLRSESLLEVARFLMDDPALRMNFLMDVTAVDYCTFGQAPAPAFFASSGVAVSPSSGSCGGRSSGAGRLPLVCWSWILSWSFIRPSRTISGRGGHPGM